MIPVHLHLPLLLIRQGYNNVKLIQLKIICFLFIASLIYTGCSNAATTMKSNGADSAQRDSSSPVSKTSQERGEYSEEEDIKNLIREMSQLCNNPITKDTVFILGNDSVSLAFNHSCTGDSFPLAAKYLETYKLDHFFAHSLKSDIIVKKNGVVPGSRFQVQSSCS
jgi:hypothetical protein